MLFSCYDAKFCGDYLKASNEFEIYIIINCHSDYDVLSG